MEHGSPDESTVRIHSIQGLEIINVGILEGYAADTQLDGFGRGWREQKGIHDQLADKLFLPSAQAQTYFAVQYDMELFLYPLERLLLFGVELKPALLAQIAREFEQIVCGKVEVQLIFRVLFHKRANITKSSAFENWLSIFSKVWKIKLLNQKGLP